jgi:hypothetical protein
MLVRKTFLQWLQEFDQKLRIMEHATNPDIDVLYCGKKRLCSVPKGLKTSKGWSRIHDKRTDAGYVTSQHSIPHRSISGIGLVLLKNRIINSKQFVKYFISSKNKQLLERCRRQGLVPKL